MTAQRTEAVIFCVTLPILTTVYKSLKKRMVEKDPQETQDCGMLQGSTSVFLIPMISSIETC